MPSESPAPPKRRTGRPYKDPAQGPMSDAERARAYRHRKESIAAEAIAKSTNAQFVAERTDAELLEALRQALTDVRRQPTRTPPKQRAARILAEFARRYPNG